MSEEDAVSEPDVGHQDVETAASGGLEDPPGTAEGSARDEDSINPPQEAIEPNPGAAIASTNGGPSTDTRDPRPRSPSSTRKRDRKKKGRSADGEPAMSVEDLFVTISTVQVCTSR